MKILKFIVFFKLGWIGFWGEVLIVWKVFFGKERGK